MLGWLRTESDWHPLAELSCLLELFGTFSEVCSLLKRGGHLCVIQRSSCLCSSNGSIDSLLPQISLSPRASTLAHPRPLTNHLCGGVYSYCRPPFLSGESRRLGVVSTGRFSPSSCLSGPPEWGYGVVPVCLQSPTELTFLWLRHGNFNPPSAGLDGAPMRWGEDIRATEVGNMGFWDTC